MKKMVDKNEIEQLLAEIPIKERISVTNYMFIKSFLVDIEFIPKGFWSDEKEKKYGKIIDKATKELTKMQLQAFKEWEKDGRPK